MKKIFIAGAMALTLTACQIGPAPTPADYTSLYNANVKAELQHSSDFFRSLVGKNQEMTGNFSTKLDMQSPEVKMTVKGNSDMRVLAESTGQKSEFVLSQPKFSYEAEKISGDELPFDKLDISGSADSLEMISSLFGVYAKYNNLQLSAQVDRKNVSEDEKKQMNNEMMKVLDKITKKLQEFSGKWMHVSLDEYQQKQNAIMLKLYSLTVADFEKYLTKYQIFTPLSDTGVMTDSKVKFDVQLNHQNLVNLIVDFVKDIGEYDFTDEEKKNLLENLQQLSMKGTIVFDSKDPLYSEFNGEFTSATDFVKAGQTSGTAPSFVLATLRDGKKLEITGTALNSEWRLENDKVVVLPGWEEQSKITLNSITEGDKVNFVLKFFGPNMNPDSQEKLMEMFSLSGMVEDKILKTLDGTLSAGWFVGGKLAFKYGEFLTAEGTFFGKKIFALEHTVKDGRHSGNIIMDNVQAANWILEMKDDYLSVLSLNIANLKKYSSYATEEEQGDDKPLVSLHLVKKDNDDFARGEFSANVGTETVSAQVAIQSSPKAGKFGLVVDKISLPKIMTTYNADPIPTYFEFFATSNTQETEKTVTLPTDTIPIEKFTEAMDQLEDDLGNLENSIH